MQKIIKNKTMTKVICSWLKLAATLVGWIQRHGLFMVRWQPRTHYCNRYCFPFNKIFRHSSTFKYNWHIKSSLYFYIHLLYYRQFLHCVLSKETILSHLILGFIFSDHIIFHGDISFILSSRQSQLPIQCLPPQLISKNGRFQYLGTW